MKINRKYYRLAFLFLCLVTMPFAQAQENWRDAYQKGVGNYSRIYNGEQENGYSFGYINHPYWHDEFKDAQITYQGVTYQHVLTNIDMFTNQVIVLSPDKRFRYVYQSDRLENLVLNDSHCFFVSKNQAPVEGWLSAYYQGEFLKVCLYPSIVNTRKVVRDGVNLREFVRKDVLYLYFNGKWNKISQEDDLIKVIDKPYRKELRQFCKLRNLNLNKNSVAGWVELCTYVESLLKKDGYKNLTNQLHATAALPEKFNKVAVLSNLSLGDKSIQKDIPAFVYARTKNETNLVSSDLLNVTGAKASTENLVYTVGNVAKSGEKGNVEIHGVISSFKTGEPVVGVRLHVKDGNYLGISDALGHYRLEVPRGKVEVELSGMGVIDTRRQMMIYSEGELNIELEDRTLALDEVTVTAGRIFNVNEVQMGVQKLQVSDLKTIPTAFGELDVLQVIQTLPGVKTTGEGSGGFSVRGGSTDQNLILFNDGTIYNPSHLFGFFSAFNGNMLENMELYKSSVPAQYGGRISSVLDITSRKGDKQKYTGEFNLGLLTSSFNVEGPIAKGKTSFLLGGRMTYSDWILGLVPEKSGYKDGKAGFYDLNAVLSHTFNEKNNILFSGYFSHDSFQFEESAKYAYANANASMKYTHLFNGEFPMSITAGWDHYDYNTEDQSNPYDSYRLEYNINQYFTKWDFMNKNIERLTLNWGLQGMLYQVMPGQVSPIGSESLYALRKLQDEKAFEGALYGNTIWDITPKLSLSAGVRFSLFRALGPRAWNQYQDGELPETESFVGQVTSGSGEEIKTWMGPEFRASLRYNITDDFSVKAGLNSMRQYIHKLSNTLVVSPTDIWKLSDANIRPQTGNQVSLGFYKDFGKGLWETSIEGYYKKMEDYLDYRSGAQLLMNSHIETDVVPTHGKAYGVEVMLKKQEGSLNGWVSYTYSRTLLQQNDPRIQDPVNGGDWYPAEYDKPHEFKLVGNYQFTQRYSTSFNIDYSTGRPQTLPISKYYDYTIGSESFFYTNRNEVRIPDYFRMDFSFNIKPTHKITAKTHVFFTIGCYNITGRKNVYSIYFKNENGQIKGYKMSVYGSQIPYASVNIKF